ncbi:MAG: alpha amylase C-terminal domain-containing protein, partial [Clostridia bacterium]|nr:alpha amylase C-terminal domain-containing protein [Clostridia bacterium]
NYKWNMGWMNDVTSYMATDPYFRSYVHNKLTFSMMYAFSENYVLPISHDEVVHGKKSLLDKMPGGIEQKFANLRTFLLYMFAHPGKKLSFMGNEFGQFKEWNYQEGLEFFMLKFDLHNKLHEFNKKLNKVYKSTPPLYNIEDGWDGFEWISTDEKDNNIVIFSRKDKNKNLLIAILNFSGNDYKDYSVGCEKGDYKLIISSDEQEFGGSGKIKTAYRARKEKAHSKEYSIKIDLPKFSGAYFLRKIKKVK